jgi:biopolymer transport protein ExbD
MALKSRSKITPQFELSSMTDLVFLLLIFFMLITTLIVPNVNALKLTLPSSNTSKPTEGITVSVSINKNFLSGKKDPTIILHTDNTVPVENVVKVMDIANKMKVKMVLATYPEK